MACMYCMPMVVAAPMPADTDPLLHPSLMLISTVQFFPACSEIYAKIYTYYD